MELQKIYTDLILEFTPNEVGRNKVVAIQGDSNSRCLAITFKLSNKEEYLLDEQYTYLLNVKLSNEILSFSNEQDNSIFELDTDNNRLIVNIPSEILTKRRMLYANVSIVCGDSKLTSEMFCISVLSAVLSDNQSIQPGGQTGTLSYNTLTDKPKINGRELIGDVNIDFVTESNIKDVVYDKEEIDSKIETAIDMISAKGYLTLESLPVYSGDTE